MHLFGENPDIYEKMIATALTKRKAFSQNRNKRFERIGEYRPLWTFHGPVHRVKGCVTAYFYGAPIFAIDFVNKRLTDFGMRNYSMSTGQNVRSWSYKLLRIFSLGKWQHEYGMWTQAEGDPKFRNHVDWLWRDMRSRYWFCWDKFDPDQAKSYLASTSFLRKDQNWRYFEYDWDENGLWTRRFINEDAERRWKLREKRSTSRRTKNTLRHSLPMAVSPT